MEGCLGDYTNFIPQWWLLFVIEIPKIIKESVYRTKAFLKPEHHFCGEAEKRSSEAWSSALVGKGAGTTWSKESEVELLRVLLVPTTDVCLSLEWKKNHK